MGMSAQTDQMSIAKFFTTERRRLVRYVRHLIDDSAERDGEDIVQDVALNLFSRADVLMPIETLSAYVYQSLRNRVIDYLRRHRNTVSLDESIDEEGGSSLIQEISESLSDAEKEVTQFELRKRIYSAIERLPGEQKAVVIETELNGRSFRDLSLEWGISIGTLLARKSRALAKIRESLLEFKPY
jgi:RNA polymerase sigma-70 factor (ECF subfamily)